MLSEVPEDWSESKLEDVCEILDKFRVPLNSDERQVRKGNVPYWGANGIVDYIDEAIFDEPLLLMPEDGGPFGEARIKPICHKIDEPVWVNNHAHVLRVTGASREYVYQWFVNRDITDFLVGGTRAKLNQKALRTLPIFLPPLSEQHSIAEILSSVDESIQATQAVIEQAERVKRGLMEELLTGGLGSEAIERGEVPEGWKKITLQSISEFITKGATPTTYGYGWESSGVPFFRSECVSENGFTERGMAFISNEAHDALSRSVVEAGDFLISITGNVGRVAIVPNDIPVANINQHIARVRVTSNELEKQFIYYALSSPTQRRLFNSIVTGQAYPQLSLKQIRETVVLAPSFKEQKRIAEILSSVDETIASHKANIEQQSRVKKGLMDDLLTGKVRTV